jgi:hypothetical protein
MDCIVEETAMILNRFGSLAQTNTGKADPGVIGGKR